jgi:hypothetical protein
MKRDFESAMDHQSHARLQRLIAHVRQYNSGMAWHKGISGLTLELDYLAAIGAAPHMLAWWEHGRPLEAAPHTPKEFRNHRSVSEHSHWADAEWSRLERLGKIHFYPAGSPRPAGLNVNPCALLLKKRAGASDDAPEEQKWKARLLCDLKRSHVNDTMPTLSVRYGTVELAISRIASRGFLFVIDLADSFFNWMLTVSDSMLMGFYSEARDQYGRHLFCPFGLRPAPAINDDSVKELLRLLEKTEGITLTDFVDDMLGCGTTLNESWDSMERAVRFLLAAGVPVSPKPAGLKHPSMRQVWVGWVFDTLRNSISVERSKCQEAQRRITQVLLADDQRTLRARQLASAAGLLSHIGEIFLQGRRRLHHVWSDMNRANVYALWSKYPKADPLVSLCEQARMHLEWWRQALDTPPERPLHCAAGALSLWGPKSIDLQEWEKHAEAGAIRVIETDASKLVGWSYHVCSTGRIVSGEWDQSFVLEEAWAHNSPFINFKELWVARECIRREDRSLRGWSVLFRVDNSAAVHYVCFRYGRIQELQDLAESLELAEREAGCWAMAVHIKGAANVVSDAGSRDVDFAERWNRDPFREASLSASAMEPLSAQFGPFDIDLFCDREGWSTQAPRWRFPECSAFELTNISGRIWAFPPRAIAGSAVRFLSDKVKASKCEIVLVIFEDTGAPWFRPQAFKAWHRCARWRKGSRVLSVWDNVEARWKAAPPLDMPLLVLTSFKNIDKSIILSRADINGAKNGRPQQYHTNNSSPIFGTGSL